MSLARKLEMRDQCALAAAPPGHSQQKGILPERPPRLALPVPAPPAAPQQAPALVEGHQVKRMSQAEMEERYHLGLCFNCNEKFGRGFNQVCQRIFLLDLVQDDDDDDMAANTEDATPADPQISLHAITGVSTSETMQMHLTLGSVSLLALIDSGSTHNRLAEEAATRVTLSSPTLDKLRVTHYVVSPL